MVSIRQWANNLTVTPEHIDYLINLMLEREIPMTSRDLAFELVGRQLENESAALQEHYRSARIYNPSDLYEIGQRVIFPALKFATATVEDVREGNNPDYGPFKVISVQFETDQSRREFAINLATSHKLSQEDANAEPLPGSNEFQADEVIAQVGDDIIEQLEQHLLESDDLVYVARQWFPRDLILPLNEGHLNLVEAVLEMAEGKPLTTQDILEQIGGISTLPMSLQVFSLNYVLKDDDRFDEVGPAGTVLWYLVRREPESVRQIPAPLRYTPIEYDRSGLTPEMVALEMEIADELSQLNLKPTEKLTEATFTLIYPHRRAGTLPLNLHTRQIFPTARRAPRIYVTLIDAQDGEEYVGWVVHREQYVYGLSEFYLKHKVPMGGYVKVRQSDEPGKVLLVLPEHRPRSEYIRLIVPKGDQWVFDDHKRHIGVEFDDLMVIGIDDISGLDQSIQLIHQQRKTLVAILKMLLPALGKLTPQATVHAKTLYAAVNVIRRYPPGPLLATLNAHPDFENVGGHYWRLAES